MQNFKLSRSCSHVLHGCGGSRTGCVDVACAARGRGARASDMNYRRVLETFAAFTVHLINYLQYRVVSVDGSVMLSS